MSYSLIEFDGKTPQIGKNVYIGDNTVIIGNVIIEDNVNIWSNCSIRGDINQIIIKKNTNIQENSVLHTDEKYPCIIGENCTIGHRVILHSTTVGNNCLVGMGSILLDNSKMEDFSMIGAGALLSSKKIILSKELWLGSPAVKFRDLKEEEINHFEDSYKLYIKLASKLK